MIGFLTTALFVTHLAVQLPGGRLIDRHGARRMGLLGLAVVIVGNALALSASSLAVGIAGRLVTGIGTGRGLRRGSYYVRSTLGHADGPGDVRRRSASAAPGSRSRSCRSPSSPSTGARPYVAGLVVAAVVPRRPGLAPADRPVAPLAGNPWTMLRDRRLYPLAVIHTASFGFSVILGIWTVSLFEHDGYRSEVGGVIGALTLLGGPGHAPARRAG